MRRSTLVTYALTAVLIVSYLGTSAAVKTGGYVETDLVANKPGLIDKNRITHNVQITDDNLVNPWGVAESSTSPFWVSDNGTGVATLYSVTANSDGSQVVQKFPPSSQGGPLVVRIPLPDGSCCGAPTGVVFNPTQEFKIPGTNFPATFIFATEDGTIVGWNRNVDGTNGIILIDHSSVPNPANGAVYKGLAIATDAGGARLYVTNFRSGIVEMYDGNFLGLTSPPAFVDERLPDSYAPFNIALINGELFVTYAVQDAIKHDDVAGQGHGIVDLFGLDGTFRQRFAQHDQLNSPWGVALAPTGFGELGGALWIGNFGNGQINAFDPDSGKSISKVRDPKGQAVVIDGLWTIRFGNGPPGVGGLMDTLYFTAGPNGEKDGLFGRLNSAP
jgi:uncharacterized protein (TIGR03118 family)